MNQRDWRLRLLQIQVQRLEKKRTAWQQISDRYTRLRLGLFVIGSLLNGVLFLLFGAWPWFVSIPFCFAPFVFAVVLHRQVDEARRRLHHWMQMKQSHLARMRLDWDSLPPGDPLPRRKEHPFMEDVDVLGPRSLHRLLDTAVSQEGSQRLRSWLLETEPRAVQIFSRQAQVRELMPMSLFRNKLALEAALVTNRNEGKWVGQRLLNWLQNPAPTAALRRLFWWLLPLSLLNLMLFGLNLLEMLPPWWIGTALLYGGIFIVRGVPLTATLFEDAVFLDESLHTLKGVFGFLEGWRYGRRSLQIGRLCEPFLTDRERPSAHIRRVRRVVTGVGLRQNWLLGLLLNAAVPWDIYFAWRLGQRQQDLAERLPQWLDVWFELEALSALATFADLNPGDIVFPEIVAAAETSPIHFRAQRLGHPLIEAGERVTNDFEIAGAGSVTIITGSNMAGKSSFLRTLGVNLVLAYAGGPVMAQSLQTSLFRLFASIRVSDSLTDGYSFFYAEVRRLEQLLSALQEEAKRPLFFLIDEIFRGTNNRERLIGSRAYVRALAQGIGAGVIATHDLELVQLAQELPTIRNFHFRDDVQDGRMVFDYKLHPGPCPTTNALKIMRLAGLPVEE